MHRPTRRPSPATAVWLVLLAAVLLLKAAVPMLASASASRQGVSLADVCSVYGVRTEATSASTQPSPAEPGGGDAAPGAAHGHGDACALGALVAGPAPVDASAVALHAPDAARSVRVARPAPAPIDPSRRWLAERLHAPPFST